MTGTLVDTNVLLDIVQDDEEWFDWSTSMMERAAHEGRVFINSIIYAEVAAFYSRIETLDEALPGPVSAVADAFDDVVNDDVRGRRRRSNGLKMIRVAVTGRGN